LLKDIDWYGVLGEERQYHFKAHCHDQCGTQNSGFNTSCSFSRIPFPRTNALPGNREMSGKTGFAFQSASLVFRGSYLTGRFLL
jgi:hypothetical protein